MESFRKYLQDTKTHLQSCETFKNIHLVIGNESCDLDSTVAALALAYLIKFRNLQKLVIPILNIPRKYFGLRTETCFLLKEIQIDPSLLIFKDEIALDELCKKAQVQTTLVDHHVLARDDKFLDSTVVEIFDHRPINANEIAKGANNIKTHIETVGSCCTLIANEMIKTNRSLLSPELAQLLYSVIIYDTLGLDKDLGKTFDQDLQVAAQLEKIRPPTESRKELFNILWKIHNDTSNISTKDLLYRDMKFVDVIPIPGLPLLVEDYLKRNDAQQAIDEFMKEYHTHSVILMGIDSNKELKRDFAIISTNPEFSSIFIEMIKTSNELFGADLQAIQSSTNLISNINHFRQGNVKLSRKFMLPLITEAFRVFSEKETKK